MGSGVPIYGPRVEVNAGVRQGDALSPFLFNLVVDAILRLTDVTLPGLTNDVQKIFYADDGRLGGEDRDQVQRVLTFMADCFARVGLQVNGKKTVSLTNRLQFRAKRKTYGAQLAVMEGQAGYSDRWTDWVDCSICGKVLQNRSLRRHCIHKHPENVATHVHPTLWSPGPSPSQATEEYRAIWPPGGGKIMCPAPDCLSSQFGSPSLLRTHWAQKMHLGKLRIFDNRKYNMTEHQANHHCNLCNVWRVRPIDETHAETAYCKGIVERLQARDAERIFQEESNRSPFKHRGVHLTKVDAFLYLGRVLTASNNDHLAVHRNLTKAKQKWSQIRRILSGKAVLVRTYVRMYKAVVLSVLLYGCETWDLSLQSKASLESFHNRCVRTIMKEPIRAEFVGGETVWTRPTIQPLLWRAGLETIQFYVACRRAKLNETYQARTPGERIVRRLQNPAVRRELFAGPDRLVDSEPETQESLANRTVGSTSSANSGD